MVGVHVSAAWFVLRFVVRVVFVCCECVCGAKRKVCVWVECVFCCPGDVAQMVERSLSMREVQGSIPCFSIDHVTVIKSVGISTFPNVHFAVCLRNPLTLSNTFLLSFILVLYSCLLIFLWYSPML